MQQSKACEDSRQGHLTQARGRPALAPTKHQLRHPQASRSVQTSPNMLAKFTAHTPCLGSQLIQLIESVRPDTESAGECVLERKRT